MLFLCNCFQGPMPPSILRLRGQMSVDLQMASAAMQSLIKFLPLPSIRVETCLSLITATIAFDKSTLQQAMFRHWLAAVWRDLQMALEAVQRFNGSVMVALQLISMGLFSSARKAAVTFVKSQSPRKMYRLWLAMPPTVLRMAWVLTPVFMGQKELPLTDKAMFLWPTRTTVAFAKYQCRRAW